MADAKDESAKPKPDGGSPAGIVKDLVLEAIKGGSVLQKGVIVLPALGAIVALVIGGALINGGHGTQGFILAVLGFVLLLLGVGALLYVSPARTSRRPDWEREVPKIPLEESVLDELSISLEAIRTKALACFKSTVTAAQSSAIVEEGHVRANVLLPDCREIATGEPCVLTFTAKLMKQMNTEKEKTLRFRPGEGISGHVFLTGEPMVKRPSFGIDEDHLQALNPSIKMIASFPLKDARGNTLAVLCLDFLHHEVRQESVSSFTQTLTGDVDKFAARLAQEPRRRLSMSVEDLETAAAP